ncbi:formylglycine-generating enzyme family protein [bacterium]|nr:formylglycine-generating enzyme family protein [bacterium]
MKRKERMILLGLIVAGVLVSFISEKEEKTNPKDYTERAFGISLEMVYVEGGTFRMGATAEQGNDAEDDEYPVRTVKIDGYYIGKYEVTEAQWNAVMGKKKSWDSLSDGCSMDGVDWYAAQAFCEKLSEQTGKRYVLPTEAQWEYAARGGNKSRQYKYAGSNDIEDVAWYKKNTDGFYLPFCMQSKKKRKKANELGLYDMSGGVYEWCLDWYGIYDKEDTDNPQGPTSGEWRVIRSGCFSRRAVECRVSCRIKAHPEQYTCGFRVVCISE